MRSPLEFRRPFRDTRTLCDSSPFLPEKVTHGWFWDRAHAVLCARAAKLQVVLSAKGSHMRDYVVNTNTIITATSNPVHGSMSIL